MRSNFQNFNLYKTVEYFDVRFILFWLKIWWFWRYLSLKYLSNSTCRVFRLFWSISSCSLSFLSKKHLYLSSSSFIRYELKPKASFKAAHECLKLKRKFMCHTPHTYKNEFNWNVYPTNLTHQGKWARISLLLLRHPILY